MVRILILATAIVGNAFPVCAQQGQGPDFPSQKSQKGVGLPSPGSDRGPAFPKSVSPSQSNPTPSKILLTAGIPEKSTCTTERSGGDKNYVQSAARHFSLRTCPAGGQRVRSPGGAALNSTHDRLRRML